MHKTMATRICFLVAFSYIELHHGFIMLTLAMER
jgi:hypothetical protein